MMRGVIIMVEDYLKNLGSTREVEIVDQEEIEEQLYRMLTGRQIML